VIGYLLRRLLWALPTLALVGAAVFVLVRLIPGDPVLVMLGDAASPDQVAEARAALGLDRPIPVQFWLWAERILAGDLGRALTNGEPVAALLQDRFATSAAIVLLAVGLAVAIAVPAGTFAAWRQGGVADLAVVAASTLLLSIPSFWLGLMLLLVFGLHLAWLPVVGYVPVSEDALAGLTFLVLPVVTLALVETGVLARMARASAVEVMRLDYVTHARAKGLPERRVLARHVLPNAFGPTWTLIGLVLGNLLGGIAVLETVFTIPGLGRLLVDAIFNRDYPVIQGCLLLTAGIYVLVNLAVDLCYPLFDPRVTAQ
jgi:peptide/nickel transport system permease protein